MCDPVVNEVAMTLAIEIFPHQDLGNDVVSGL